MRRAWLALAALAGSLHAAPKPAVLLVEGFEQSQGLLSPWKTASDKNGLGTVMEPEPFTPETGGVLGSPKGCGCIHGHLGPDRAPYTWAQLSLGLNPGRTPMDLGAYQSLRFWVKGDGKRHVVKLMRAAVEDFDHFKFAFPATKGWTQLKVPFSAFTQSGWGKSLPREFHDVTAIQFEAGVHDSDYSFCIDQVELSSEPASLEPEPYDTKGWSVYPGFHPARRRGTALDSREVLDAPAGKHGWVAPKGEDFVFAKTGKPVRFFGVNLVAGCNFPTHEQSEALAETLAEMGVNITRHHHADAPWATHNFFGKGPTTRKLDPESMDRFDYLVAQLQKHGIYQYFDLLVHRQPLAADGIEATDDVINGWKVEGEFAPKLISLQEEFTRQFLGHKNPYTGKVYGQDPAIAGMEIINEDSLWFRRNGKGDFSTSSPYYRGIYQGLYNRWLTGKYKSRAALDRAWAPEKVEQQGLADDEDPLKGTVKPVLAWDDDSNASLAPVRLKDAWAFDGYLMEQYHGRMSRLVRSLGYQGPITGSNHWVSHPADLALNAKMGFLDRHAYWAHPQGGWDYSPAVTYDPSPMLGHRNAGIAGELAGRRVQGVPYIATEWGDTAPNDYRADGPLTMGVACSLQNWSAIQFAYSHTDEADFKSFSGPLASFFDVMYQPVWMALWPAVTRMVQRGDIAADQGAGAWTRFSPAELADPLLQRQGSGDAVFAARTGVSFAAGEGPSPAEARAAATKDGWVQSPGGVVRHNPDKGILVVAAERSAGAAGLLAGEPLQAGSLKLSVDNAYAVVLMTSLDGKPLAESRRSLLVAGGNAVNTGMAKRWGGGGITDPGKAPVLVEPVHAKLSLACNGPREVWALDSDGQRSQKLEAQYDNGELRFSLNEGPQALAWELDSPQ
jgi:hypothetical protein